MSSSDDSADPASNSAPDLQILGDEITLQPSGFVEPDVGENREQALMHQFASFRAEPLQCVGPPSSLVAKLSSPSDCFCSLDSSARYPSTSPAKDGAHTITSSASPSSTAASRTT